MLTNEQREARKLGIGGSDAAAVAGISRYKTPVDVYLDKTSELKNQNNSEAIYFGNILEPVVAAEYTNRTGKACSIEAKLIHHPKFSWMLANIDRRIVNEDAILECKTANAYSREEWGESGTDEFPDEYLLQCAHYAAVCDVSRVDLAVLIGGQQFRIYHYHRDQELENRLIEIEYDFWHNHVLKRLPPAPKTYEEACKLWNQSPGKQKTLPSELLIHINNFNSIKNQIKELEEKLDFEKAQICGFIGDATTLIDPLGKELASWKEQTSERLDSKRLKSEQPALYNQYIYTTKSRVLRIKESK